MVVCARLVMLRRIGVSAGRRGGAMGSSVSRIGSSSSVMVAGGFSPVGEVGEAGVPAAHRGRRTMRAFVQALRRAVKQRRPSLYSSSSWSFLCRRSFRRSEERRRASPTASGVSKRKGLIFFFLIVDFLDEPLVEFVLVCASPPSLSELSERSLSQSPRSIQVVGCAGSPGGRASEGSSWASSTTSGKDQSVRIFEARMLRTASFCLRRSLLVRSASYSVRAEVLAMERRRCAAPESCIKSMLLLVVLVWGKEAMNSVLLRVGKLKLDGFAGSIGRSLASDGGWEPGAGADVLMINAGLATGEGEGMG